MKKDRTLLYHSLLFSKRKRSARILYVLIYVVVLSFSYLLRFKLLTIIGAAAASIFIFSVSSGPYSCPPNPPTSSFFEGVSEEQNHFCYGGEPEVNQEPGSSTSTSSWVRDLIVDPAGGQPAANPASEGTHRPHLSSAASAPSSSFFKGLSDATQTREPGEEVQQMTPPHSISQTDLWDPPWSG